MHPTPRRVLPIASTLLLVAASAAHAAEGLNLDFGTEFSVPAASYGAASGQAGTWNQVGLGPSALTDVTGSPSVTSVDVVATTDTGFAGTPVDDAGELLNDNFYSTSSTGWSVSLSGLPAGDYLIFLYAPTNGVVSTGAMTVDGIVVASLPGDAGGSLVPGTSWTSVVAQFAGGTLVVEGSGATVGLAGLQVLPLSSTGLNVDFGTEFSVPAAGYGAASGQAGAWNQSGLGVSALVDVTGAAAGASVSVVATTDTGFYTTPTDDAGELLSDNFFATAGSGWSVSVAGLAAGDYRIFLYAPSNPSVATGSMTVDGTAVASLPGSGLHDLVEGTSWESVDVTFAGGTLTIEGSGATVGLAGLQVVPLETAGLNLDFGTEFSVPSSGYGAASGQAGTWNQVGLGTSALLDATGAASVASVGVAAFTDTGFAGAPVDDAGELLNDNFFSSGGGSWSVSVAGLAAGDYAVFLYAPTNGVVSTGAMTVDGIAMASLPGDSGGNLVLGTSWTGLVLGFAGGTLEIAGGDPSASGLAGLQVVPLPEPGGAALLASGFAYVALLARRRRGPPTH